MVRRPPGSTLFPTRRSSDLVRVPDDLRGGVSQDVQARDLGGEAADGRIRRRAVGAVGHAVSVQVRVARVARSVAVEILLRSEEHTSELQSQSNLVCRLLLEK